MVAQGYLTLLHVLPTLGLDVLYLSSSSILSPTILSTVPLAAARMFTCLLFFLYQSSFCQHKIVAFYTKILRHLYLLFCT